MSEVILLGDPVVYKDHVHGMDEVILLGDPVVYKDHVHGMDEIGVVTNASPSYFKVLWNDEMHSKVEIYERLRLARLDEVDAQCRVIRDTDYD